jgi:hypothetical protein
MERLQSKQTFAGHLFGGTTCRTAHKHPWKTGMHMMSLTSAIVLPVVFLERSLYISVIVPFIASIIWKTKQTIPVIALYGSSR